MLTWRGFFVLFFQMGPKAEDVQKPVNPFTFLFRFLVGTLCAAYYVWIPIFMWIKDLVYPKDVKFVEDNA